MNRVPNHAGYLTPAFDPETLIGTFRAYMGNALNDVDALVGTGISGAMVVPLLAMSTGKAFGVVRKDNDGTHSWLKVERNFGEDVRWLFVDDLIASGGTARRVVQRMAEETQTECVGAYLYAQGAGALVMDAERFLSRGVRGDID